MRPAKVSKNEDILKTKTFHQFLEHLIESSRFNFFSFLMQPAKTYIWGSYAPPSQVKFETPVLERECKNEHPKSTKTNMHK